MLSTGEAVPMLRAERVQEAEGQAAEWFEDMVNRWVLLCCFLFPAALLLQSKPMQRRNCLHLAPTAKHTELLRPACAGLQGGALLCDWTRAAGGDGFQACGSLLHWRRQTSGLCRARHCQHRGPRGQGVSASRAPPLAAWQLAAP